MEAWKWLETSLNDSNLTDELCPLNETATMHSTWVYKYFGECVLNIRQYFAFIIGMLSILCWLVAQIPQYVTNCRYGNADKALSFWFLLMWLVGDAMNLIGALLTKQLATQVVTAVYFLLTDLLSMLQFLYYLIKNQGVKGLLSCFKVSKRRESVMLAVLLIPGLTCTVLLAGGHYTHGYSSDWYTSSRHNGRILLSLNEQVIDAHNGAEIAGYIMGCFSGLFYICSRIPQLVKNLRRCSVEGLSLYMFLLALAGNITYALGIFLYSIEPVFLLKKLPWLVGSVVVIFFDVIIVFQFVGLKCLSLSCTTIPTDNEDDSAVLVSSVRDSESGSIHCRHDNHGTTYYGTIIQ